jgi:hypothetical protein
MPKEKISFTLNGIKYKDISAYKWSEKTYSVGVAGTAQMVRQWMSHNYPAMPSRNYYWVQSESYAGGDSIRVYLNNAPEDFYKTIYSVLQAIFQEGKFDGMTDMYTSTKGAEEAQEGFKVDYGTKYLFVQNQPPYGSDAKSVDWSSVLSGKAKAATPSRSFPSTKPSYSMGETLKDCAGWTIYKKTLPDGRIVYNAKINPATPKNKGDWNEIKGEVYVDTGFKWGKFGAFEKWGQMEREEDTINRLCSVLGKYYDGGEKPAPAPEPAPAPTPEAEPTPAPQNDIPANPKLKYCRIVSAEGFSDYIGAFPKDFSSFTELTKYIADNIGELPESGYDKHNVEWQWKFEEESSSDRWDVSQAEANPFKYPNLYASEKLQMLSYNAWFIETPSKEEFKGVDEFYSVTIGKDGLELNDEQFNAIINEYVTLYKPDKKRFKYNTPEERIERFKEVYPKLYNLFNTPQQTETKTKADIEKAIKGLQYLADKGNEKAIKAIKGLQYLLNK